MPVFYHATNANAAEKIKRNGFQCGRSGLAGGGIYFAENSTDAMRKSNNGAEAVLRCDVDLGRCKTLDSSGDSNLTLTRLNREGFDSVRIIRNGDEYVVYEAHRVRVLELLEDEREQVLLQLHSPILDRAVLPLLHSPILERMDLPLLHSRTSLTHHRARGPPSPILESSSARSSLSFFTLTHPRARGSPSPSLTHPRERACSFFCLTFFFVIDKHNHLLVCVIVS